MSRGNLPSALTGAAALTAMLDCIGATEESGEAVGDHAVAKILVEIELALRKFLRYSLDCLVQEL